jgi:hypothetical protein
MIGSLMMRARVSARSNGTSICPTNLVATAQTMLAAAPNFTQPACVAPSAGTFQSHEER